MQLALFNGSPRYKKSNSKLLIEHFLTGYGRACAGSVPVHYFASDKREAGVSTFQDAEIVIIIFPLYTDCMPGIVKEFFEDISELALTSSKKIGFIVQSGFPEAIHSTFVERYLKKLVMRLKCEYLGTVIKGGVEGIQSMPPSMTRKLFTRFEELGEQFAKTQTFSPDIIVQMRRPYKMSFFRRLLFSTLSKTGITNFYWNSHLKKNGAFENRFARPYMN